MPHALSTVGPRRQPDNRCGNSQFTPDVVLYTPAILAQWLT